jgi:hypothetical protein
MSCVLWSCRWLLRQDTDQLSRPDLSHYVVDILPDFITAVQQDGVRHQIPVIQIWVDPRHRDAHRDPALRAFIERRGQEDGSAAIIRYSSDEGFVLIPPALTGGDWIERRDGIAGPEHSAAEKLAAVPSHFVSALNIPNGEEKRT